MPIPISPEIIPYLCGISGTTLGLAGFAIHKIRAQKIKRQFEIYEHNTVNDPSNPTHIEKAAKASANFTQLTGRPIEEAVKEARAKFRRENEKLKEQRSRKRPR